MRPAGLRRHGGRPRHRVGRRVMAVREREGAVADHADLVRLDLVGPAIASATGDHRWATCEATLIAGGKSNLTFVVRSSAGELVLRRPPSGTLLPSAHDMG